MAVFYSDSFVLDWDEGRLSKDTKIEGIINVVGKQDTWVFTVLAVTKLKFTRTRGKAIFENPTVKIEN